MDWVHNQSLWFARVDAYLVGDGRPITTQQLINSLIKKIIWIFQIHNKLLSLSGPALHAFTELRHFEKALPHDCQRLLAQFIKSYATQSRRRPLLFIDNLDHIYHLHDRTMFTREGAESGTEAIRCVQELTHCFLHDTDDRLLGDLGANVLFSLRSDSYRILQESARLFRPDKTFDYNRHATVLRTPPWREVVKRRGELLTFAVSKIPQPGKRNVQKDIIAPILTDLEYHPPNQVSLIEHLERITNYGRICLPA